MSSLSKALVSFITILGLVACGGAKSTEAGVENLLKERGFKAEDIERYRSCDYEAECFAALNVENTKEMWERVQNTNTEHQDSEPSESVKKYRAILEEYKP